jgi:hypothetical protein
MPVINVGGGNQVSFSFGAVIALIVLVVCIILAIVGTPLSVYLVLGLIGALALARLT